MVVREARLARRTLLARRHRLQEEHAVARTPLQRRAQLADLSITTGSGGCGRARHLDAPTAFTALRR